MEDCYMALSLLPLIVSDMDFYKSKINHAKKLIEKRDPNDVHLLALSFNLNCPIWSNDNDFKGLGIKVYSTLDLIME